MVRVTPEQYSLLSGNVAGKGKKPAAVRRKREDLPENIVTKQIVDYLRAHGWTLVRQHVGMFIPFREYKACLEDPAKLVHPIRIGEDGMADWRAERPIIPADRSKPRSSEMFYIEFKAPGRRPSPEQKLWIARKRATGTPAVWFDCFYRFREWYVRKYGVCAGDRPTILTEQEPF